MKLLKMLFVPRVNRIDLLIAKLVLVAFLLIGVAALISCIRIPVAESQVCKDVPDEESFLCQKSRELGYSLEDTYGIIYTTSAVGAITEVVDREWICDFDKEISEFYLDNYPNISTDTFITEFLKRVDLVEDPNKVILLKNIVNQNVGAFRSPELIKVKDDSIMRGGNNRWRREMLCEPIK
jgi:hypothetical protein